MTQQTSKYGKSPPSDSALLQAFIEQATSHRELFIKGDVKGSNRAHDRLIHVAVHLRERSDRGERLLRELIRSDHEAVRSWAAYFLLPIDENLAVRTMQDIAESTQSATIHISNETTLAEWKAGRLDVDWFMKKK